MQRAPPTTEACDRTAPSKNSIGPWTGCGGTPCPRRLTTSNPQLADRPRRRRQDPVDGQAVLLEEAS